MLREDNVGLAKLMREIYEDNEYNSVGMILNDKYSLYHKLRDNKHE